MLPLKGDNRVKSGKSVTQNGKYKVQIAPLLYVRGVAQRAVGHLQSPFGIPRRGGERGLLPNFIKTVLDWRESKSHEGGIPVDVIAEGSFVCSPFSVQVCSLEVYLKAERDMSHTILLVRPGKHPPKYSMIQK